VWLSALMCVSECRRFTIESSNSSGKCGNFIFKLVDGERHEGVI
jgi:hypothetical protein